MGVGGTYAPSPAETPAGSRSCLAPTARSPAAVAAGRTAPTSRRRDRLRRPPRAAPTPPLPVPPRPPPQPVAPPAPQPQPAPALPSLAAAAGTDQRSAVGGTTQVRRSTPQRTTAGTAFQQGCEKGRVQREIGHNLARERPKLGHNLVRKRQQKSGTIQHANETRSGHNFVSDR